MTKPKDTLTIPVVAVCGPKKSGKTTLVEQLLAALRARGYAVGTVKHSAHKHLVDKPGTDSYRHRRAGAKATLFVTPEEAAFFTDAPAALEPFLVSLFTDVDLILVEGLSREPWPKVVVLPKDQADYLLELDRDTIVAVLTDLPAGKLALPQTAAVLKPGEVTRLASFLEQRFALQTVRNRRKTRGSPARS